MARPLIEGQFKIQKMDMKGGWSYVLLPIKLDKSNHPFGWQIVKGTIDDYQIEQCKLWPTKSGQLFLPIKSVIRKKIKKEVGDTVTVVIHEDKSEVIVPDEFLICLVDYPTADIFFKSLSITSQKQFVDYVYGTKNLTTQGNRLAKCIEKLEQGKKWHER